MEQIYQCGGEDYKIQIHREIQNFLAQINDQEYEVIIIHSTPESLTLCVNGDLCHVFYAVNGHEKWIYFNGQTFHLQRKTSARTAPISPKEINAGNSLYSPMPGQIRAVEVASGDHVESGQTLIILEAMKMEIRVQAHRAGVVEKIHVTNRDFVEKDQLLIELESISTSDQQTQLGG